VPLSVAAERGKGHYAPTRKHSGEPGSCAVEASGDALHPGGARLDARMGGAPRAWEMPEQQVGEQARYQFSKPAIRRHFSTQPEESPASSAGQPATPRQALRPKA
jgi:hypothetical protein